MYSKRPRGRGEGDRMEYRARVKEYIDDLTLMDDAFFRVAMKGDLAAAQALVRAFTGREDLVVVKALAQETVSNPAGKSVVLDLVVCDARDALYGLEVQRDMDRASPERTGFYLSLLSLSALRPGDGYSGLAENYVVWVVEGDKFGLGWPTYRTRTIIEGTDMPFDMGFHAVFVNALAPDDTPLGRVVHDLRCRRAEDMYTPELASAVRRIKQPKEGEDEMAAVLERLWEDALAEGKAEGRKEGRAEGMAEASLQLAKAMIADRRFTLEEVSRYSGLDVDALERLQASMDGFEG